MRRTLAAALALALALVLGPHGAAPLLAAGRSSADIPALPANALSLPVEAPAAPVLGPGLAPLGGPAALTASSLPGLVPAAGLGPALAGVSPAAAAARPVRAPEARAGAGLAPVAQAVAAFSEARAPSPEQAGDFGARIESAMLGRESGERAEAALGAAGPAAPSASARLARPERARRPSRAAAAAGLAVLLTPGVAYASDGSQWVHPATGLLVLAAFLIADIVDRLIKGPRKGIKARLFGVVLLAGIAVNWNPALLHPDQAPQAVVETPAQRLSKDHSQASTAILDDATRSWAAGMSQDEAAGLFADKAALRDLSRLAENYADGWTLRHALRARSAGPTASLYAVYGLGKKPDELAAFAASQFGAPAGALFKEALFSWETLNESQRSALKERGVGEQAWLEVPFKDRDLYIREWAKPRLDRIMETPTPWSSERADEIEKEAMEVWKLVPVTDLAGIDQRMGRAVMLTRGLALLEGVDIPDELKDDMAKAKDPAAPLPEQIAALSRLFAQVSPMGGTDPAFIRRLDLVRESRPEEVISEARSKEFGSRLTKAVLRLTAAKDLDWLAAYYKEHALVIEVADEPLGTVAEYSPKNGHIIVARHQVEAWLRTHGREASELLSNKAVFASFLREAGPVILHETVHQYRSEGKGAVGDGIHYQEAELEAMSTEATFILAQMAEDPEFARFVNDGKGSMPLADSYGLLARSLLESPRRFRQVVSSFFYSHYPTLEAQVAVSVVWIQNYVDIAQDELKARREPLEVMSSEADIKSFYADDFAKLPDAQRPDWLRAHGAKELRAVIAGLRGDQLLFQNGYRVHKDLVAGNAAALEKSWKSWSAAGKDAGAK